MLNQTTRSVVFWIGVTLAGQSFAYDFSDADARFGERAKGPAQVQAAIEMYAEAESSAKLTVQEKIYAVEQLGRLYMYWGYIVEQGDKTARIRIADLCIAAMEKIKPSSEFPANPTYYYWRAACLMARANAKGIFASLTDSKNVADAIDAGLEIDPAYEGGGLDKLGGLLYSKLPDWNPLGPNGDMARAMQHFRRALDSDVYDDPNFPDWKDPDTETGDYFYSTYYYYAVALHKDGQTGLARKTAQDALDRIEDEDLPVGREPEAMVTKARLKGFLGSL